MKITLMKAGALYCAPCKSLDRRGTLEKFAAEHPDVHLEIHDDNETGDSKAWAKFADKWDVKYMPTLIWVVGGEEVLRSQDTSMIAIEAQYKKVLRKIE